MSLSLEDFNTNFTVRIANYNIEDSTAKVVFEVKCNVNRRVGVFIQEVDTTTLNQDFTSSDVINTAWDLQKTNVNDWAVTNFSHEVLSAYTPTTVAENSPITLTDFNNNFAVSVRRYELYPFIIPHSWCVGFVIQKLDNVNTHMFVDNTVPIELHCNNVYCATVVGSVWDLVKSTVCNWAASELAKVPALNSVYTPATLQ